MGRILGLDVGNKKIGIAMTDLLGIMAQPHKTIRFTDEKDKINQILQIIKEFDIKIVVIGLPKNMDSSEGEQAKKTREFAKKISEKLDVKIEYVDERLTTKKAFRDLNYMSVKKIKQKGILDTQAAINILQTYLSTH